MNLLLQHCQEINRCNQRGGRMLSVVDLLEADTFSLDVAAYLLAAVGRGASSMVCALPGGAGKTTVMGALINFIPTGVELQTADSLPTMEWALKFAQKRNCFICHEISTGLYYAYLWGDPLRTYFELARRGHMLATNMHAANLEDARRQICDENRVSPLLFRKLNLILFMEVGGGWRGKRAVSHIWESDGHHDHHLIFSADKLRMADSRLVSPEAHDAARQILEYVVKSGARDIQQVRQTLLHSIPIRPMKAAEKGGFTIGQPPNSGL